MLRPGSLNTRFHTVERAEATAREVIAALGSPWLNKTGKSKTVPKPKASIVLKAGQLLDWFAARQVPLSPVILTALVCALRVEPHVRRIEAAAEAHGWAGTMTAKQIAATVGFSERQIFAWRKAAPAYPEWASGDEAIAAARAAAGQCRGSLGEAHRYPSPADALVIYSALRHFSQTGLPIPEGLWWCGLCAMGLADYEVGLLESTIEGTQWGRRFPDALRLIARWDAERDFAGKPRRTDADILRRLQRHFASRPRSIPERATVVSYRGSEDYERHVTKQLIYVRMHHDPRTAAEKHEAWLNLVAAVKAEDALEA